MITPDWCQPSPSADSRRASGAAGTLADIAARLSERASAYCESTGVPGYLAGLYHGQVEIAYGIANTATGAAMREDTGFLFGSIIKTMTGTLLMQQVERGVLDPEDRVITHLPLSRVARNTWPCWADDAECSFNPERTSATPTAG